MGTRRVKILIAVVLALALAGFAGCGSDTTDASDTNGGEPPEQTQPKAEEESLPKMLSLSTHPQGSLYNALGSGLASVASKYTPMEVKAIATSGPGEWGPSMETAEGDLGIENSYDAKMGYLGKDVYEEISGGKGFPIRLLTNGSQNVNSAITAGDSGIESAEDIKGKKYVGIFTGSAGITAQAQAFLANHGLAEDDVQMMTVPGVSDGIRAIIEGRADVNGSAVIGMGIIQELDGARGARFLSIDPSQQAVDRLQEVFPGYPIDVEPGPNKLGVQEPITMMTYQTYLVARASLSDEAAYEVVKALWENNDELGPIHPKLKQWTTDQFVTDKATVPYHPGAIKFYKEKGVWNEKMDEIQAELLSLKQ